MILATWLLWLWKYFCCHTEDSDCIADLPIANFFLMSCVYLPSLVKIELKYTHDLTFSKTSLLRLILVLVPLFPHAITFVLSVLISNPTFSLEAFTRSTNSCWSSDKVAMSTASSAYRRLLWSLCLLSETLYCSHPKLLSWTVCSLVSHLSLSWTILSSLLLTWPLTAVSCTDFESGRLCELGNPSRPCWSIVDCVTP